MRKLYWILSALLLLACGLQTIATQPAAPPPAPTDTLIPAPVEATQAEPTPTLEPVALAGPPMQVGSMWPYVDGSILVAVPGGDFIMGHGGSDNPEHTVTLSDFWIYQGKVTNQQYALCVNNGDCKAPDPVDDFTFKDVTHANDPVVGVNYKQAADYCTFVHGRLPTEAEWEKTARGPEGNLYPWGTNAPVCDFLNFNNCVGKITKTNAYPTGQSFYHALDLEGNVYEWVADWYDPLYYKISDTKDPKGPDTGRVRSVRSSSYKSKTDEVPASTRRFEGPNTHLRNLGFRCVVDDPGYFAPLCTALGQHTDVSKPDCPKVGIGVTESCKEGKVTLVVVDSQNPDPNAHVDAGTCVAQGGSPGQFPQTYTCTGSDVTATVRTSCNFSSSAPATCADHFTLNSSTGECEWDGSLTTGTACLPGTTYDPIHQCCTASTGVTTSYQVCGLGSALATVNGKPACVPDGSAINDPSATEYIHIPDPSTCTGSKQPGGTCTLNANSCGQSCKYGGVFSDTLCKCICWRG